MAIPTRPFGRGGPEVTTLGLGTRPLSGLPDADALAVLRRAVDAGITLFDAADSFDDGRLETLLGRAAGADAVVITKGGRRTGFSPAGLEEAVGASRTRLGRAAIPVYLLDRPSAEDLRVHNPMATLARLRDRGWIGIAGVCADSEADGLAALQAGARAVETPFNILQPVNGYRLVNEAYTREAAVVVREPLARGVLAGRPDRSPNLERHMRKLAFLARDGRTLAQGALQFALAHEGVTAVLFGASTTAQVDEAVGALDAPPLTETEFERIFDITGGCREDEV